MIVLLPMILQFIGGKIYNAPTLHGGELPQMIDCFSGGVGMKKKKTFLIIMFLLLLLICVAILFSFGRFQKKILLPSDENAEEWNGNQKLPTGNKSKLIEIPGFQSLVFFSNEEKQKVNFHNPESNSCLMKMSLYADDVELWHNNDYLAPGKGYYEIEVDNMPDVGNYAGKLQIQCYTEDGTELNGAVVNFDLMIKE